MKNSHTIITAVSMAAMLALSTSVLADHHGKKDDAMQKVDVNTPDEVLLEGKNVQAMSKVLKPSVRLTMSIEGVDHDIKMSSNNGITTLHVPEASANDVEKIRETYAEIANTDDFEVVMLPVRNTDAE